MATIQQQSAREIVRAWAVVAPLFVVGVLSVTWQRGQVMAPLGTSGVLAPLEVLEVYEGTGPRGEACPHARYRFVPARGAPVVGDAGCLRRNETLPPVVTYLPADPRLHRPGDLRGYRVVDDMLVVGAMALSGVLLLLLAGLGARALVTRWDRRL